MATPISASTSYCSPAQFLEVVDNTILGDLVMDDGTRATPTALLTNTKLQFALNAASGELEMAALVGERYSPSDLQALTGVMAYRLQELVAWLALGKLMGRRNPAIEKYPEIEDAQFALQAIREGVRIFGLVEAQVAGLMAQVSNTSFNARPLPSLTARRFFGIRERYVPIGQNNCGCG